MKYRILLKKVISNFGIDYINSLENLNLLFKFGKWKHRMFKNVKINKLDHKFELYSFVHEQFIFNKPIDYFEFGVYKGASLVKWLEMNNHDSSRFYGFDSFEGLPEVWKIGNEIITKEKFDVKGAFPDIKDNRVRFIKGWFQETLNDFIVDHKYSSNQIIVHIDSDLYSSALFVLTSMDLFLKPGAILIFDEFSVLKDEFKAFMDYSTSYLKQYEVVAYSGPFYDQIALIIK